MSKKLILFPFGGNARDSLLSILAINAIRKTWNIIGFMDDSLSKREKVCCGIKVKGGRELIKRFSEAMVLAVPGNAVNYLERRNIIMSLGIERERFATIIHPSVIVAEDAEIGYNVTVMPNVFIGCGAKIGNHCVILPNTVVSHDSKVGDYCCIGSSVAISGYVNIGRESYIGSGVKIRENICIGNRALVGIGSNVVSDIEEGIVAIGNPARRLRKVK